MKRSLKVKKKAKESREALDKKSKKNDPNPSSNALPRFMQGREGIASSLLLLLLLVVVSLMSSWWTTPTFQKQTSAARKNVGSHVHEDDVAVYVSQRIELKEPLRWDVPCSKNKRKLVQGCHLIDTCGRVLQDNFVSEDEIRILRVIAEKGMQGRSTLGGPTIMDANTGYVKDSEGLINIYQNDLGKTMFATKELQVYKEIVERIKSRVMEAFGLNVLYFSAPTFITRLIGNESWIPQTPHDEYWHPHVDKQNTEHYDYSGLLYLSDYGQEFTGGLFAYMDKDKLSIIEPRRGRLSMFTSGAENLHQVQQVTEGTRLTMSLWFTCSRERHFANFLDGKVHRRFQVASDAK